MIDFEAVKIKISKSLILIDVKKQRYMMWNRGYNIYLVASFQGHLYKLKVTKHVEDGWYLNNMFCTSFSFGIQKMVNSFKEKKDDIIIWNLISLVTNNLDSKSKFLHRISWQKFFSYVFSKIGYILFRCFARFLFVQLGYIEQGSD